MINKIKNYFNNIKIKRKLKELKIEIDLLILKELLDPYIDYDNTIIVEKFDLKIVVLNNIYLDKYVGVFGRQTYQTKNLSPKLQEKIKIFYRIQKLTNLL